MRRQNRNIFHEDQETKKMLYIAGGVVLVAILAFVITFFIYSNLLSGGEKEANLNGSKITDLAETNRQTTSQASNPIGKTVNEVQEQENTITNGNTTKIAINTSNMEKEASNQVVNEIKETKTNEVTNTVKSEVKKEEKVEDPTFVKPVEGEVVKEFAKDTLVYSDTLKEWITHTGIDIKADKTTVVKAAADGTIKSIKNDPRYGITVVIEHTNGFCSVYSNLLTADFVKEKEVVKQGQTIGTVGNTATFEIADDPHLHFEILKDSEYLDPNLYIQ